MTAENSKQRAKRVLGMSREAAERRLRKVLIVDLARRLGVTCPFCHVRLVDPEDLAVIHIGDWWDAPSYFDVNNIALGHESCKARHPGRGHGDIHMDLVHVRVENENGTPLVGTTHEGQTWVGGKPGQRYNFKVTNHSNKRVMVVSTVDGRDVNTGKPGDLDSGDGFVLAPYQSWTFKGYRTSDTEVAAFRLTEQDKSVAYAAQMSGTTKNLGIIGVAVFEEFQIPRPVLCASPGPSPSQWLGEGYGQFGNLGGLGRSDDLYKGGDLYKGEVSSQNTELFGDVERGTQPTYAGGLLGDDRKSRGGPTRRRGGAGGQSIRSEHDQAVGTEFGESVTSQVSSTTFKKASATPAQIIEIRYDSIESLQKAGILRTPEPEPNNGPSAFPNTGYCPAPSRQRYR